MIAYYLQASDPPSMDRARAVLDALTGRGEAVDTVVVSPAPAPLGWPTPWVRLDSEDPTSWRDWVAQNGPSAVIVDGPATQLHDVGAAGRTVAVMAAPGWQQEPDVLRDADLVLAPWAAGSTDGSPAGWRSRIVHLGALGWAARQALHRGIPRDTEARPGWRCVALAPTAGGPGPRERRRMLTETPGWWWWSGSERDVLNGGPTWAQILRAHVVVCAATPGNLAALVAARVPAVLVLPEHPSAAELFLASIARETAPVVVTEMPRSPHQWRFLLTRARELDGSAWAAWDPEPGLRTLRTALGASRSDARVSL